MNRATKAQKEKVTQFCGVTGASSSAALGILSRAQWDVAAAINQYYSSGGAGSVRGKSKVNMCVVQACERGAEPACLLRCRMRLTALRSTLSRVSRIVECFD